MVLILVGLLKVCVFVANDDELTDLGIRVLLNGGGIVDTGIIMCLMNTVCTAASNSRRIMVNNRHIFLFLYLDFSKDRVATVAEVSVFCRPEKLTAELFIMSKSPMCHVNELFIYIDCCLWWWWW